MPGYSTGLNYWVQLNGYATVLADDWAPPPPMTYAAAGDTYWRDSDHSLRIDKTQVSVLGWDHSITETTEKMAYSGVYKIQYAFPPYGIRLSMLPGTYRKK